MRLPIIDRLRCTTVLALVAASAQAGIAAPTLDPLFQDHAVLQRGQQIVVRGTSAPGATIQVTLAGQHAEAHADDAARWQATLPPLGAGGPYDLEARDAAGGSAIARDVLIGDVWLCSGQSNMEMQVRRVSNLETEIGASANSQVRLLHIERSSSVVPLTEFTPPVHWLVAGPRTVDNFSAACYFFGREIEHSEGVPVGLIDSSWGGSIIQAWMSAASLRQHDGSRDGIAELEAYARDPAAAAARWQDRVEQWWRERDPAAIGPAAWSTSSFDDQAWPVMRPAGWWENSGVAELKDFDGIVWFRTSVSVTAAQAAAKAMLDLGPIDDIDTTWVNGVRVGSGDAWDQPRFYPLAAGTLHEGSNIIAVRVLDTGGGGGMWGPPEQKLLRFADGGVVPVGPSWHFRVAGQLARIGVPPHSPWTPAIGLTTLYNGMIHPLAGFGLRGVLWYQGEANAGDAAEYAQLLPLFFQDWRREFNAQLPVLVVQLADFGPARSAPADSSWAALRESQRRVVDADAHAGLAVTIDIGDRFDIHPTNKQEVGHRLALLARHRVYGEDLEDSGPEPTGATQQTGRVTVEYAHAKGGLVVQGSNRPAGFEICEGANHCRYSDAVVAGTRVVLRGVKASPHAHLRYAWSDSPLCNLYNAAGLPAVPFDVPIR